MEDEGVHAHDVGRGSVFGRYDAVVLHWPDNFAAQGNLFEAAFRSAGLVVLLTAQRLRGADIVRVAHDVGFLSGRPGRRALIRQHRRLVDGLVTHLVFLSRSSAAAFSSDRGQAYLARRGCSTLFHPRFGPTRKWSPPPADAPWRFIGDVKPYKGLPAFLHRVARSPAAGRTRLEVYGAAADPAEALRVEDAVRHARAAGAQVSWDRGRPDDAEMTRLIEGAKGVVLPYAKGWNSGLAYRVLESGRPVLASKLPMFDEIAAAVGEVWVRRFGPGEGTLEAALEGDALPTEEDRERLKAYLETLSWSHFATAFLGMLAASRRHGPTPQARRAVRAR